MFKSRRGEVSVDLNAEETDLLRNLIADYEQLLDADHDANDPVRRRLFPDASLDDHEANEKFIELTRDSLDEHKRETIKIAIGSLGPQGEWQGWVSEDERDAWLCLLADLRLAIGVRIGVTDEMMERDADPRDPQQWPLAVLHYLGALQGSLVDAVMR
ncbi:MAG: DUF2017 family protein [Actinomycetota bacterium]|nr:DUF2017 domain-containing protein [Actinomycetota bacterium]